MDVNGVLNVCFNMLNWYAYWAEKNDSFAKADVTIKCLYTGVSNYVNSIMVKINYEINLHSN